jgi:CRP/FNR family transcriptional regulator, cyclic AMP receptor protein
MQTGSIESRVATPSAWGGTIEAMSVSLLDALGPDGVRALRQVARRRTFRRREIVFREGDIGTSVHFIEQGHVIVRAESVLEESLTLAVLGPGDHFGDIAVLSDDSRRSASVEAIDSCVTHAVPAEHFLELRDQHAAVRRAMAESLARTNRRLVERLLDARHVDARGRLQRQLSRLGEMFGEVIPFTQEDLAAYVGVTRVTVNQILASLVAEGAVELRRGSVRLLESSGHAEPSP